jgi:hypothetical protein
VNFQSLCAKIVTMATIDSALAQAIQDRPDDIYRVIVRVQGDLQERQQPLQALGFTLGNSLRLVRGFSATAPGPVITRAQSEDWIVSIEPDGELHTMLGGE